MTQPDHSSEDLSENLAREAARSGRLPKKARKPFAIALFIVIVTTSCGNILIKYSFEGGRSPSVNTWGDLPGAIIQTATNIWLILAIILLITEFIAFIYAMRLGPLSLVVPIRGAASYIFTALLAQYFLEEQVSPMRWSALVIILLGVIIIGFTAGSEK